MYFRHRMTCYKNYELELAHFVIYLRAIILSYTVLIKQKLYRNQLKTFYDFYEAIKLLVDSRYLIYGGCTFEPIPVI